jgi:hypothetical protein
MINGILRHLEELVNSTYTGKFLAGSLAVTLLACGVLLVATLTRRQWRWLWIGTVLVSFITVLLAGVNIAWCRIDLLTLLTPEDVSSTLDPSQRARLIAEAFSRTTNTRVLVGIVVGLAMAVLALSILRDQPIKSHARLVLVCVGAVFLTSIGTIERERRLLAGLSYGHSEHYDKVVAIMGAVNNANQAFTLTKYVLVGITILGAAWLSFLAIRDIKRGLKASRLGILSATTSLISGVGAYAGTRGHAHDAYHLLPQIAGCDYKIDGKLRPLLPVGPTQECNEVPLVQFLVDQVTVDGTAIRDPPELENILRLKHNLWHEINPGHKSASLTVGIVAADGRDIAPMLPWLEAVNRSGFKRVGALYTIAPKTVTATATLGKLARERCGLQLMARMPATDEPSGLSTWGDVVRSARSNTAITVTP